MLDEEPRFYKCGSTYIINMDYIVELTSRNVAFSTGARIPILSRKYMAGYEYSKDGGASWQDSNLFSGLSSSTTYSFVARIKATAAALSGTVSTALSVTTSSASSGGTSSGGGSSTPSGTGAPVIVDGKTQNIGTEKKSGDTTTVTVNQSKLGTNINGATSGSSVVVPVSENGSATASLVVKNIEDMETSAKV